MMEDLPVCPKMRCNSFAPFPDALILPCAKHGTMLVPYSDAPIIKKVYRWLQLKIFKIKYVSGRVKNL